MTMQANSRRLPNAELFIPLTPVFPVDHNGGRNDFRNRVHSLPSMNFNPNFTPHSSHSKSHSHGQNSSSINRKRRSYSSAQPNGLIIVNDEPDNKKKKGPANVIPADIDPKMSYFDTLSNEMMQYSAACEQTQELLEKKLRLRSTLLGIFRREFPGASLHLVGSSCNGFASQSSDADFCLMLTHWRHVDQRFEAVHYLRTLHRLLKHFPYIRELQVIRAKVPILKFKDSVSACECDININNSVGIRNTHLLRTYSRVDKRVRPLIVVVKRWANLQGINNAHQGTLSSYSLVLMVIHYLQAGTKIPVIPSLQQQYPDYFRQDLNLDYLPMFEPADMIPCNRSANKQTVGELFEGFLDYYANNFRWDFLAVSVRLGRATPKALSPGAREKPIFIEEPFDLTNTARSVHCQRNFDKIRFQFKKAHQLMKEKPPLAEIFSDHVY
ncbi:poly(A) RNA polymerase GLD2-like [Rhopilema esculentum]|uniref:poly(A) RNA polymerase GLD2-like n=1 Tax=Rhopilema esculentum TaxID=499914 RepID=UPI0031D6D916